MVAEDQQIFPNWLHIEVAFAPVPMELTATAAQGVLWQAAPGQFLLQVPEVARFLVEDGQRITIDPHPGVDPVMVKYFSGTTPLAALFYQRGKLAFHAAAVLPPAGSQRLPVLLAGDSAAGKSTLAVALQQRGWTILTDEMTLVAVDKAGNAQIWPISQDVLLWEDAFEKLNLPALEANQAQFNPGNNRRVVMHASEKDGPHHGPFALGVVFWMSVYSSSNIELLEMKGAKAFNTIGTLIYNSHIADAQLDHAIYMGQAARIAQQTAIYQLRRPRGLWCVPGLVEKLEEIIKTT